MPSRHQFMEVGMLWLSGVQSNLESPSKVYLFVCLCYADPQNIAEQKTKHEQGYSELHTSTARAFANEGIGHEFIHS